MIRTLLSYKTFKDNWIADLLLFVQIDRIVSRTTGRLTWNATAPQNLLSRGLRFDDTGVLFEINLWAGCLSRKRKRMTLIEFGSKAQVYLPLVVGINHLYFKDRALYFGLNNEKAWIRTTPLRVVIPILYLGVLSFFAYCTYLLHWA